MKTSEPKYKVKLEDIFEGPMDLLVYLIKKNKVNIHDIPIAKITNQYLKYIEWMKYMNIDLAGDFLIMAATLTYIKLKMLLPIHEKEDGEDPRTEISRPLEEYIKIKAAAQALNKRNRLWDDTFPRGSKHISEKGEALLDIGLFELIDAFQKIIDRLSTEQKFELTAESISIKDKISEILETIQTFGSITFNELFSENSSKAEMIVTFLAILEMTKLTLIRIYQNTESRIIRLFYYDEENRVVNANILPKPGNLPTV